MSVAATRMRKHAVRSLDTTPKPRLAIPTDPEECVASWSEVVFGAILTLKSLLSSQDEATALEASRIILDLEKTRIRHKLPIAGTEMSSAAPPRTTTASELPTDTSPTDAVDLDALQVMSEEERFEYYVELARCEMQAGEDERGSGDIVTPTRAVEVVRMALDASRNIQAQPPPQRTDPQPKPVSPWSGRKKYGLISDPPR